MAQILVRRVDDDVKERLKARAKKHGRSLEAEARAILEGAAKDEPPSERRVKKEKGFGTLMHERFKKSGLTKAERRQFDKGIEEMWRHNPPRFVEFDE
jgi:plasmid stability protein